MDTNFGPEGMEPGKNVLALTTEALIYPFCIYSPRDGENLLEEVSELIGLQVYTNHGVFLGNVNNLVVDVENGQVEGIFVGETNPLLVEGSRAVSIPYRWIQNVGDIVILRYFPKRVSLKKGAGPTKISETKKA